MADSAPPAADALFGSGDGKPAEEAAASSLFDAGTATDGAQDIAGVFGSSADDPNDPFANVGLPNDTAGDVAGSVEGPASAVLEDYANQGWYDDDGKFHLYEDPNDTFNATSTSVSVAPKTNASNAYTPQTSAYSSPATQYAPSTYGPSHQSSGSYAYAPPNQYAPPTTYAPPTSPYVPASSTYVPPTSPYAPPKPSYAPPPGPFIPPPPASYAPPPPPAASTNEHLKYRSPSANAYDPPIPAPRKRIDSAASSVSTPGAGAGALMSPFGQTAPAGVYPPQLGHGHPLPQNPSPPGPPGPPRSRAGSQITGSAQTLSPADALNRTGSPVVGVVRATSPLAGVGAVRAATGPPRVGSPLVGTASPYAPPAQESHPPPKPAPHGPPARSLSAYDPPATGTKSAFDPPMGGTKGAFNPPMTGRKNAFDPPMTGTKNAFDPPMKPGAKNAFDPPMTGRKNAFDPPPMTGRKNAFDPPPATSTKSAFDPPVPPGPPPPGPPSRPASRFGAHASGAPITGPPRPGSGFAPPPVAGHAPPRPRAAYDPPSRPASSASVSSGRFGPSLDTSGAGLAPGAGERSKSAIVGGSKPWDAIMDGARDGEGRGSLDGVPGRGSLDGADSGYKSRTSIDDIAGSEASTRDEWTRGDDPEGGDAEGGHYDYEGEASKSERGQDSALDPEGGADPEGGYDDMADTTVLAPTQALLGVGPRIMETAPTPIASPGMTNMDFGEADAEDGFGTISPVAEGASGVKAPGRTTSISSLGSARSGHKSTPSISKRPSPVMVEPPSNTGNYVVDTQPYTPMYGQSPYADIQASPPKKTTSDPYAPPKTADPYAPPKPASVDPYAPPKPGPAEPHAPSKFTGEPTQRVTYSPPNGLARVYTPPPQVTPATARPPRNGSTLSRKSSLASNGEIPGMKDPYAPAAKDLYAPPASKDPYAPTSNPVAYAPPKAGPHDIKRPASTAYDPPMPAVPLVPHPSSYTPGVPAEMYAPHRDSRVKEQGDLSDYEGANGYTSRYNYSSVDPYQSGGKPNTPAAYVPAPGGVDPLGRHDSRAPVISFGFGGRLVTAFPGLSELTGGFDVSLGRKAASIQVRTLHKIVPESAVEASSAVFPGPLFSDPGSPTKSLVSVGVGGSSAKTKKAAVIKYLGERAEEIGRGLGYLAIDAGSAPGPSERSKAEAKLVIVNLLKIMVENDGRLSGTSAIDAAVRHALVPRLSSAPAVASPNSQATSFTLASALEVNVTSPGMGHYDIHSGGDSPVATYKVKPEALDKIQEFLLQGERRQAYHYALDERMWAHAMLISSSLDKEAWKEVVNEFIRSELGVRTDQKKPAPFGKDPSGANGREPLRVAYSLFAGHGPAAIQELLPPKNLSRAGGSDSLMPPTMPMMHATPISPSFPQPVLTSSVPAPALLQWQEIAATIISNQADPQALTALGDYLVSNKWTEAAHVCYLLSPLTSALGGISTPSVRVVLLGAESPTVSRNFEKDDDAIIFTEIAEYAYSLVPTVKGQEPYAGLPHLQAYKLIRAVRLAEMGHLSLASRYCEAITISTRSSTRPSPFFTPCFAEQCKELSNHLSGVQISGSWVSKKVPKPSLDSIGNWLSGGLTKLIAGDGEEQGSPSEVIPKAETGAFSHYSNISSANTSQTPSPNASVVALPMQPGVAPPRRAGSAMAHRPGSAAAHRNGTIPHPDRSASAMDYLRPPANKGGPGVLQHAFSANAATTTFYQADAGYRAGYDSKKTSPDDTGPSTGTYTPWWGDGDESSRPTPTATTFYQVNDASPVGSGGESESGFISLMDTFSPMPSPAPAGSSFSSTPHRIEEDDELEDLGLGNSNKKREERENKQDEEGKGEPKEKVEVKEEPKKEETKQESPKSAEPKVSSSSWLSRLWPRKEADSPGPVKANLGEQMSLVYDKELKRWVNPNAPKPETAAAPPPPPSRTPSRAQTGSPGPGPSPLGRGGDSPSAPPSRPQSASSLVPPPSAGPRRVRSMLSESFGPSDDISSPEGNSQTSTPPASLRGPPSRGSTPAGKRNVRSRYVDVFAQPPPSPST